MKTEDVPKDEDVGIDCDNIPVTPLITVYETVNGLQESIVTIGPGGTVTIHKEGGDKEAARIFYEALEIEGKTLHQKIAELEAELKQYKEVG